MLDWYHRLDMAADTNAVSGIVTDYLRSIGEAEESAGETYEETALRLYDQGNHTAAGFMQAADEKWMSLECED